MLSQNTSIHRLIHEKENMRIVNIFQEFVFFKLLICIFQEHLTLVVIYAYI